MFWGSLTDSICTAYENKNIKSSDKISIVKITNDIDQNIKNESEKSSSYTPVANSTLMLGGKEFKKNINIKKKYFFFQN